jgi:hypothetical protein
VNGEFRVECWLARIEARSEWQCDGGSGGIEVDIRRLESIRITTNDAHSDQRTESETKIRERGSRAFTHRRTPCTDRTRDAPAASLRLPPLFADLYGIVHRLMVSGVGS